MSEPDFGKVTLLVVEDEMFMRSLIVNTINDLDFRKIAVAKDGVEALKALRSDLPDVVLLDIEMPNLDGFGFLETLRGSEKGEYPNPDVPVIMLTGDAQQGHVEKALKYGIHGYLIKPITKEKVVSRLNYALTHPPISAGDPGEQE
ncbi:MAG: response regulator [Alphaproteobacteria bacterium]|nr:response regulator [Alphaproteobacteria bacterium]